MTQASALGEAVADQVVLGLGEWHVSSDRGEVLVCLGLGSCVALSLHDATRGIGGLAHMVLPDSSAGRPTTQQAKFVDVAVPMLLERMLEAGASRSRINVDLIGGASMLLGAGIADSQKVGERNANAARDAVKQAGMRVHSEELGGNHGRTVRLHIATGDVRISTAGNSHGAGGDVGRRLGGRSG
jgi:chemotaxis protein CheD